MPNTFSSSKKPEQPSSYESDQWIKEGLAIAGTESVIPSESSLPEWADVSLLIEGRNFFQRHTFSIFFAHLISLLILLAYGPVRIVLYKTGRSCSVFKSKVRYFSTLLHVKKWYEGDLTNEKGVARQDILKVRRIHFGVSQKIKDQEKSQLDENNNDASCQVPHPRPPINQLDMAVTQFCFMGFVLLFPKELGISSKEIENGRGIEGYCHLWAVLGHLLGIRPEYNVALPENRDKLEFVWRHYLLPEFRNAHPDSVRLWEWLVQGVLKLVYFLTLKSLVQFIYERLLKEKTPHPSSKISWDSFCFFLINQCFKTWLHFWGGRTLFNFLINLAILTFQIKLKFNIDI